MSEQITIESKKKLSATEIKEVGGYNEREIRLVLVDGCGIFIRGSELKIISFSKETGGFLMEGKISDIKFSHKKQDFFKRVFK